MANDDNEKWFLPAALRITNPKVALESAELRKQLQARTISPFARVSPLEFAKVRAAARIDHLSKSIEVVTTQLRVRSGRREFKELRKALDALSIRLAENYAVLGFFALAAEADPRQEYKKEYLIRMNTSRRRK